MALPIRPSGGLPGSSPTAPQASSPELSLPSLPALPELLPEVRETSQPATQAPRQPEQPATQVPAQRPLAPQPQRNQEAPVEELPEGWVVDKKTGKRYKRSPGYKPGVMNSKAAVRTASDGGMSLDQMFSVVELDPDFSLDDLNGSAEVFMAHLRVPPNKAEQQALLEERARREKSFTASHSRTLADEDSEEEDV